MPPKPARRTFNLTASILLAVCSIAYVLLSWYSPSSTASRLYHLTHLQIFLLQLTILLPMIAIWFTALWGALSFRSYALMIKQSPESHGLALIAVGLMWLLIYLVILTISGAAVPYFKDSDWLYPVIALRNHLPVASSLIGFALICWGSHRLKISADFKIWTRGTMVIVGVFSLLAAVFAWLFISNPATPINSNGLPQYALPGTALVFTLVLPYCWAWFLGTLAALNITKYARRVKGVIYRKALRDLAWGISVAVIMIILMQLFTFSNRFLTQLGLGALLLVVYGILIICSIGFLLIRSGAKKLIRLEVAQ